MYKYFIHIGVDPLDLILQQIIDVMYETKKLFLVEMT